MHKQGDHDNASKAATKAERLSSAAWKASKMHEDVERCSKCGKIKHSGTCKKLNKVEEDGAAAMGGGAPTNNVGSGAVAGLGVGPQGEPGVDKRKKKSPVLQKMLRRKINEAYMKAGDTAHTVTLRHSPNAADKSRLYRYHVVVKHNSNPESPHPDTVAGNEALKVHHASYDHDHGSVNIHSVTTGHAQHAATYGGDNQHKGNFGSNLMKRLKGEHPTVKHRSNEV